MGSACSTKISVTAVHPGMRNSPVAPLRLTDEQLKIRKNLLFSTEGSENTFLQLSTPRSGKSIKWRRGDLIGEGAYGKVYQCLNLKNGELMAVKHFELSDDPKRIEKVFLNMKKEVSVLQNLIHPNIVVYYQTDLAEDMKSIDVLLEFVPGGSLRDILSKYGSLEIGVIKNYGLQLLRGLNYLHKNKIIHRDLKSANILLAHNGVLKLTDFGSSRKFDHGEKLFSKSMRGSPYWMPPEVINREGHTFSADIWSFGCVLIEMASGKPPWYDPIKTSKQVLETISTEGSMPEIPSEDLRLKEIILNCLQRNPSSRPTTEQLLDSLFFSDD